MTEPGSNVPAATVGQICVAVCVNEAYMLPMTVMVRSLLEHLGPGHSLRLFVVQDDCSAASRRRALASWQGFPVSAEWLQPDVRELAPTLPGGRHAGVMATYLRLLLGELLPAEVRRVIYLDSDMLVLDDIAPLWSIPLNGCVLGAVSDSGTEVYHSRRLAAAPWNTEVGFRPDDRYFNGGVLVIDLDTWRSQDIGNRSLRFAQRWYDQLSFHDQDALNCTLLRRWQPLPLRWNFHEMGNAPFAWSARQYPADAIAEALRAPAIIHFTSAKKPWHHHCRSIYAGLFHQYLQHTDWQDALPSPTRYRRLSNRWLWEPYLALNWLAWRGPLPGQHGGRVRQALQMVLRRPWLALTWPAGLLATWLRFLASPMVDRRHLLARWWCRLRRRPAPRGPA